MFMIKEFVKSPKIEKDRGYAWVILLMSLLSQSLHLGFSLAVIGNLTVAHKAYFNIDLQESSLIGTVHTGVLFLFGKAIKIVMILIMIMIILGIIIIYNYTMV